MLGGFEEEPMGLVAIGLEYLFCMMEKPLLANQRKYDNMTSDHTSVELPVVSCKYFNVDHEMYLEQLYEIEKWIQIQVEKYK
jgi:hypothetical protein